MLIMAYAHPRLNKLTARGAVGRTLIKGLEEKGPLWLLESAADAMLITDSNGRIVLANKPAEALFGYARTELLELSVESLIPPRFRATHITQRQDYAAHPGSRAMGAGRELYGLRKGGSEFAADVSLSPLEGGYVLATVHDITRRKCAEDALAEQSARLAAIVETAVDAIITIDERGTIDSFNPAAERLFGYKRDEVLGKNVSLLMPSPYRDAHDGYLRHYLDTGEKRIIGLGREVVAQRKDGTTFPIELAVSEMQVGNRRMFTGLVHDITLRKQTEERQARLIHELESANEELKNFAYVVSHDLKAPLRAIGSLADWISADQAEKLDEEGKEHLRLLIQRARRMDALIDGILQYSRVGRVRETLVNVDVNEIVKEVLAMLAPPSNIRVEVTPDLPVVHAERTRILQLFQNLLSNAIKYLDKPEGLIRIGCVRHDQEWEFSVSDNGPGIEPRHFKRIFQLFQTLVPKDRVESTGVGLALVKKIVELYGGRVWIESQVGVGSTFYFTLPRSGTNSQERHN
jgi:two-component system sensor kinase FixL